MGGQNATNPLCGSMASMYLTNPPSAAQPQDIYQSLASQYRIVCNFFKILLKTEVTKLLCSNSLEFTVILKSN